MNEAGNLGYQFKLNPRISPDSPSKEKVISVGRNETLLIKMTVVNPNGSAKITVLDAVEAKRVWDQAKVAFNENGCSYK